MPGRKKIGEKLRIDIGKRERIGSGWKRIGEERTVRDGERRGWRLTKRRELKRRERK